MKHLKNEKKDSNNSNASLLLIFANKYISLPSNSQWKLAIPRRKGKKRYKKEEEGREGGREGGLASFSICL